MREPYQAQSTERISNEDWCAACKLPVEKWKVFFEESIHSDSGYDKVRRCPHCNSKCFEDGSFEVGCLFFFVGIYGLPLLWLVLFHYFGINLDFDLEESGTGFGFFIFNFLTAILFSTSVCWLWKRWLYRQKQADDQVSQQKRQDRN